MRFMHCIHVTTVVAVDQLIVLSKVLIRKSCIWEYINEKARCFSQGGKEGGG